MVRRSVVAGLAAVLLAVGAGAAGTQEERSGTVVGVLKAKKDVNDGKNVPLGGWSGRRLRPRPIDLRRLKEVTIPS